MATTEEQDDREEATPLGRERRGTRRHYQAVIQAEIRRLARKLDSDRTSRHDRVDPAAVECSQAVADSL